MKSPGVGVEEKAALCEGGDNTTVEKLIEVIEVLRQTVMEVRHAQKNGPWWYHGSEQKLRMQVDLWLDKSDAALKTIDLDRMSDEIEAYKQLQKEDV